MESDWKKFSARIPVWRERYLAERNAELVHLLTGSGKTETERFWEAARRMREVADALHRCLGDLSRSRMPLKLMAMRAAGLIRPEDLAEFSAELQEQVFGDSPEQG